MMRAANLPKGAVVAVYRSRRQGDRHQQSRIVGSAIAKAALSQSVDRQQRLHRDWTSAASIGSFGNAALMGNSIFVAFAMGESRLFGPTYLHVGLDFALPILMIGFAWFAIWLATDRQVTQWINYLRRIAAAYRSGHYAIRPDLADAPVEFKLLGDALSEMADGIQDRDRRLREAVDAQDHPDQGNPSPGEEQSADRDEPALHPGQPGQGSRRPRRAAAGPDPHQCAGAGPPHPQRAGRPEHPRHQASCWTSSATRSPAAWARRMCGSRSMCPAAWCPAAWRWRWPCSRWRR